MLMKSPTSFCTSWNRRSPVELRDAQDLLDLPPVPRDADLPVALRARTARPVLPRPPLSIQDTSVHVETKGGAPASMCSRKVAQQHVALADRRRPRNTITVTTAFPATSISQRRSTPPDPPTHTRPGPRQAGRTTVR